jgi:hypothetical protein
MTRFPTRGTKMSIEYPNPVPKVTIAETPDGREFIVNAEATLRAIVASGGRNECKIVRIPINDESDLATLEAEFQPVE